MEFPESLITMEDTSSFHVGGVLNNRGAWVDWIISHQCSDQPHTKCTMWFSHYTHCRTPIPCNASDPRKHFFLSRVPSFGDRYSTVASDTQCPFLTWPVAKNHAHLIVSLMNFLTLGKTQEVRCNGEGPCKMIHDRLTTDHDDMIRHRILGPIILTFVEIFYYLREELWLLFVITLCRLLNAFPNVCTLLPHRGDDERIRNLL